MAFSQEAFATSLQSAATKPPQQRGQDYLAILKALLEQPRSEVSEPDLTSAATHFLDVAVFSDLNSSGGGLIVGRSTLSAFDQCIKDVVASRRGGGGNAEDSTTPAIVDEEVRLQIYKDALEKIQPRILSFEEQVRRG